MHEVTVGRQRFHKALLTWNLPEKTFQYLATFIENESEPVLKTFFETRCCHPKKFSLQITIFEVI